MKLSPPLATTLLAASLLFQPACAEKTSAKPAAAKSSVEASIRSKIQAQFARHQVGEVRKTPMTGIYEVVVGKELLYTDKEARYVLFGDLVDVSQQMSLTEQRKQEMMKVAFNQLPLDAAIKVVRGKGERKVAVFTDPDCPYCQLLDREHLRKIDNVTIYYFLMPLDALHPEARKKSIKVWCAKDQAQAWFDLIYDGKVADSADCAAPLDKVAQVAQSLGFSGTPGMLFESGARVPGAIGADKIEAYLNGK